MAEPVSVADQVLKKLADQLECSICLDSFTDPKMLQCFHVFCKGCLEPLVFRNQHGMSLRCPNCRRSTFLPANGVSGLQPAFHVHHLFEIQDALQKVKQGQDGQKTRCEKCKKEREANGFCCDCGKFVCEACIEVHKNWDEYSTHKVISLEQLKSDATKMVPPTKKTLYCHKHPGKELDLYCETDHELICQHCIVRTHRDHQYDLISEVFPKHRDTIASHLQPVRQQLNTVSEVIQDLGTAQDQIMEQRTVVEADIQRKIKQLHETLEVRKTELIGELNQMTQNKLEPLSIHRDELELVQTRLSSCLKFVTDSLKTSSEGEILAMERTLVQEVKEMCAEFYTLKLTPQEQVDMALAASSELLPACQQFGQVHSGVCPEKSHATGKGLEVATVGEQSTVTVHVNNARGSKCAKPLHLISCELVPSSGERMKCKVKLSKCSEYQVDYRPTRRGRHQLHIKVSDQHIRGSPFTVVALRKFEAPTRTITGLVEPWGVAVDKRGQIIIAECHGYCISIYNSEKRTRSFGRKGSAPGQFQSPSGVTLDRDGNILVVDAGNHRIQKFTANGKFIVSDGRKGDKPPQFSGPVGISISPSEKVYICDNGNHRVQILNPDLTFSASFGSRGSGEGQFQYPEDVALDSRGNVYVADRINHRIQVFTEDGHFLRKIWKKGEGHLGLMYPTSIAVDYDDVVYVVENDNCISLFTSEGHFLRSFGTQGKGPGRFIYSRGVVVDKDGLVYVCDSGKKCLQVW